MAMDEEKYVQAIELVRTRTKAPISFVQRKLKIGYNAAARMIERMEEEGIVSPLNSDGVRIVLSVTDGNERSENQRG